MKKKPLSILLVLCMVLALLPATALAEAEEHVLTVEFSENENLYCQVTVKVNGMAVGQIDGKRLIKGNDEVTVIVSPRVGGTVSTFTVTSTAGGAKYSYVYSLDKLTYTFFMPNVDTTVTVGCLPRGPRYPLQGKVTDAEDAAAIGKAYIAVGVEGDAYFPYYFTCEDDGTFKVDLPEGEYIVTASMDSDSLYSRYTEKKVTVSSDGTIEPNPVSLELYKCYAVTFKPEDDSGEEITNVDIKAVNKETGEVIFEEGRSPFGDTGIINSFTLPNGTYKLTITNYWHPTYTATREITVKGEAIDLGAVTLTDSGNEETDPDPAARLASLSVSGASDPVDLHPGSGESGSKTDPFDVDAILDNYAGSFTITAAFPQGYEARYDKEIEQAKPSGTALASGRASGPIDAVVGENVVYIYVTDPATAYEGYYKLTVYNPGPTGSILAELDEGSSLQKDQAATGRAITLTIVDGTLKFKEGTALSPDYFTLNGTGAGDVERLTVSEVTGSSDCKTATLSLGGKSDATGPVTVIIAAEAFQTTPGGPIEAEGDINVVDPNVTLRSRL